MARTVSFVASFLFSCFAFGGSAMAQVEMNGLTELEWFLGEWVREGAKSTAVETWTRVSDDTFEGLAYRVRDGQRAVTEYLRLERFGADVFYVAKPAEAGFPTAFKLVSHDGMHVVFENPDHDFPTRIGYDRDGDALNAWIEGPSEDGVRRIDFPFVLKHD